MEIKNENYLSLITSEYANSKKFNEMVLAYIDKLTGATDSLKQFDLLFNIENAVGDQLDKCGEIVSLTRELPVSNPNIPPVLPDDLFRTVIKARILSNFWDGSMRGFNAIIKQMFPNSSYEIIDGQDMSFQVVMIDPSATNEMIALLFNGYIVPKPSGVRVSWSIQSNALFGWDLESGFVKGWDEGIWGDN